MRRATRQCWASRVNGKPIEFSATLRLHAKPALEDSEPVFNLGAGVPLDLLPHLVNERANGLVVFGKRPVQQGIEEGFFHGRQTSMHRIDCAE